ncbi:MAG: MoaD/ThiS family protein [Fuerstiella sp.]|nr:MoaD/ThiS family protein [Fuerstiella sp.]
MKIAVLLFAAAKDAAGSSTIQLTLKESATIGELREQLAKAVPALERLNVHLLIAVNSDYADDSVVLNKNDKVACFPPVSGG